MPHLEQITTYQIIHTEDGYGGTIESLELLPDAPTWATVKQRAGNQGSFGSFTQVPEWLVKCNYKDDFQWLPDMVIGYRDLLLKVDTVIEAKRFREVDLTANLVDNSTFEIPSI
jgi:hypothetical protein